MRRTIGVVLFISAACFTDSPTAVSTPRSAPLANVEVGATSSVSAWIGLKNSDDVGTKFDLSVEVFRNSAIIGTGQLTGVPGGSSGFNNATLRVVNATLTDAGPFVADDTLGVRLSVRIAEGVAGHRSGTARLWYGDGAANSRVNIQVNDAEYTFHLGNAFVLEQSVGTGPRRSIDVKVDRAANGNPFKTFGTWKRVLALSGGVVPNDGGEVLIEPSVGGVIATQNRNVVLDIPPGAIAGDAPVGISVTPIADADVPPGRPMVPGSVFEFSPDGLEFERPVKVEISYDPNALPDGADEGNLRLFTFDVNTGKWRPVSGSRVDKTQRKVAGSILHFSEYGVGELQPPYVEWWSSYSAAIPSPPGLAPEPEVEGMATISIQVPSEWPWPDYVPQIFAMSISSGESDYNCGAYPTYESSNPAVLTVDSIGSGYLAFDSGEVCENYPIARHTAHSFGTAYLRVNVDGFVDSARVNVIPVQAGLIQMPFETFDFHGYVLQSGASVRSTVSVRTQLNGPLPDKVVTWFVDRPDVAQIVPAGTQSVDITAGSPGCAVVAPIVDDTVVAFGRKEAEDAPAVYGFSVVVRPKPVDLVLNSGNGLFTLTASGCGVERIDGSTGLIGEFRWSPDGSMIGWMGRTNNAGPAVVHLANGDGTQGRTLPTFGEGTLFSWSPDGSRIVYGAWTPSPNTIQLRIINSDGTDDHALLPSPGVGMADDAPEWSPDGSRIAFHRGVRTGASLAYETTIQTTRAIYSVKPDGSDLQLLVSTGHSAGFPVWSPTGNRFLYVACLNGYSHDLSAANADGTGQQSLFALGSESSCSASRGYYDWSPDGQAVRFGPTLMNPDGSGRLDLNADGADHRTFSWSSDSRQLAYQAFGGLAYRINADGTGKLQVAGGYISPFAGGIGTIRWRPGRPSVP